MRRFLQPLLFGVLEAMLGAEKEDWRTLETYYIRMMIERLQGNEQADESRLGRLEFGFLHILGEHMVRAHTLERLLARNAKLFVDCLKLLYPPRHGAEDGESKQLDAADAQRANLVSESNRATAAAGRSEFGLGASGS